MGDGGYADFRRLNDRLNQEGRERSERHWDRLDAERRHKELVAATRRQSPAAKRIDTSGPDLIQLIGVKRAFYITLIAVLGLVALDFFIEDSPTQAVTATRHGDQNAPLVSAPLEENTVHEAEGQQPQLAETGTREEAAVSADLPAAGPTFEQLQASILKALEEGKPVVWQVNGASGSVTVSAPVAAGGKTCRTVAVHSSSENALPNSEVWCHGASADWMPVNVRGSAQ